jgi:hypothetical protein
MNPATTPKDFFLHLAATIALYAGAIALIDLAFTLINRALPDYLSDYFYSSSVFWPISLLIVLTPILYVLEWMIARDIRLVPEKSRITIRRIRIYLTLFLTGATIAGDLIYLLNTYFNGEITSRFIWKFVAVLIVTAVIFAYYLLDKRKDTVTTSGSYVKKWTRILSWLGIILVLIGIVTGFVVVGSPSKQRALRFDDQRIVDLSSIQVNIVNFWQATGKLPATLKDIDNPIYIPNIPVDPETKQPYEYNAKSSLSFEICANFALASINKNNPLWYPMPAGTTANWNHPSGHSCFVRTINPNYTSRGDKAPLPL